jgi:organic radical activating enzyme
MISSPAADKILIRETFISLQGEGYFTGKAAFFIRFAGCDIGCTWCDTKDAWSAEQSDEFTVSEIIQRAVDSKINYVVITGGEPFIHNLDLLTRKLKDLGKYIHIETSGAYPVGNAVFDWISISPKKIIVPKEENYRHASELKVVVENISDIEFAEKQKTKVNNTCKLYLQPQWEKAEIILPSLIRYITEHQEWQLSLQTHKYLNIP